MEWLNFLKTMIHIGYVSCLGATRVFSVLKNTSNNTIQYKFKTSKVCFGIKYTLIKKCINKEKYFVTVHQLMIVWDESRSPVFTHLMQVWYEARSPWGCSWHLVISFELKLPNINQSLLCHLNDLQQTLIARNRFPSCDLY